MYRERFYRESFSSSRFYSCAINEGESDIWIGWNYTDIPSGGLSETIKLNAAEILHSLRKDITAYGQEHPAFFSSLEPLPENKTAAPIVQSMLEAGTLTGTGPMAAVAGAIAEALGTALEAFIKNNSSKNTLREIVIENGGDFWIKIEEPLHISVYAGLSSLSNKFSIIIDPDMSPCGLACSSGTVGPSISFGKTDAALVIAHDAAAADAWATALGNRIHYQSDLEREVTAIAEIEGIPEKLRPQGVLAVLGSNMAAAGKIKFGPPDSRMAE